jgi:1,4-dihydroxy-2-naphthoate octaprenyltransferase
VIAALRASLRIRRLEFMVAEIPIVLIPLLLAAPRPAALATAAVAEGLVAVFLLFHLGDLANCLADRDLDALRKKDLAAAVDLLGPRNVIVQMVVTSLLALALATHMAVALDRWSLPVLVAAGIPAALAYSLEPVRCKRRGVMQSLCTWAILFPGPMLFAQCFVRPWPTLPATIAAGAFGALQTAIIVVNVAEDEREDRALGVRTTVVALGRVRALGWATAAAAAGGAALLATLAWLYVAVAAGALAWAALAPIAALTIAATVWLERLRRSAARDADDVSLARVQRAARLVPLWLTLVAWATCGASAVVAWCR